MSHRLAVIVPVLNDREALERLLPRLTGAGIELIVVDGGSVDGSTEAAQRAGARVISTEAGRGMQLAAGVRASTADRVWFVHADSMFADHASAKVAEAPEGWGRLQLAFDDEGLVMRVIAWFMHWRSHLTGICTGDQGIWADRTLLEAVGGVPMQPLMEDIELCKRLKQRARPQVLPVRIVTSARRWRQHGVVRTVVRMWWFRLRYNFGASADQLAKEYRQR